MITKIRPKILTQWGKGERIEYRCLSLRCGLNFYMQRTRLSRQIMQETQESYELCPRCKSYAVLGW